MSNEPKRWDFLQSLIPPLSTEERASLKASLEANKLGDVNKVLMLPDGRIIDGHHRWELSGGQMPVKTLDISEQEAFILGIRLNLARRQLSSEQKKTLVKELRQKKYGLTQEQVGEILGIARQTVDSLESISNAKNSITYNPPDLRVKIPKPEIKQIVERVQSGEEQTQIAADYKVSQARISQIVKQVEKTTRESKDSANNPPLPSGVFSVILADPPWRYQFSKVEAWGIEPHYDTLSLDELKNYKDDAETPIKNKFAENSVLFLWAPSPKQKEALELITAWGFEYITNAVWIKDRIGMGYWWMQKHELLLLAKKGDFPAPDTSNRPPSVIESPWNGHSKKPDEVYEMIERMCPTPNAHKEANQDYYLELFKRGNKRPFWTGWGKEYAAI